MSIPDDSELLYMARLCIFRASEASDDIIGTTSVVFDALVVVRDAAQKTIATLEQSRDHWKSTAGEVYQRAEKAASELALLTQDRDKWKQLCDQAPNANKRRVKERNRDMAAAKGTVDQIANILVQEVGFKKAKDIAERLFRETTGNSSYRETVLRLYTTLKDRKV